MHSFQTFQFPSAGWTGWSGPPVRVLISCLVQRTHFDLGKLTVLSQVTAFRHVTAAVMIAPAAEAACLCEAFRKNVQAPATYEFHR